MFAGRLVRSAAFVALVATVGCSRTSGPLATVSGVVTQDGVPVDNCRVTFHSTVEVEGKRANSFSALTDSSGKYLIASAGREPGIPVGMYKVTITKIDKADLPPGIDEGQLVASGQARNLLPKDYESLTTTKLSVTLEAGKNENKNFALKAGKGGGRVPSVP